MRMHDMRESPAGPLYLADGSRQVLRLSGPDARDFLQGLVSNDLRRLSPGAPLYAALLTPQGKYLFDFLLVADGADILIDVAAGRAQALAARLMLYRLRKAVTLGESGLSVALLWREDGGLPDAPPGPLAVPDPRDAALGLRLYAESPAPPSGSRPATPGEWEAHRLRYAIPETGRDLIAEETFILEAGFERLNGVDFRKGCYVGQEVTARMKHKTELRKGLVPVRLEGPVPEPGTPVLNGTLEAGVLTSVGQGLGLARLRYDRMAGMLRAGEAEVHPLPPRPRLDP